LQQKEDSHLGNYTRIFPPTDPDQLTHYLSFIAKANPAWNYRSETLKEKARRDFLACKKVESVIKSPLPLTSSRERAIDQEVKSLLVKKPSRTSSKSLAFSRDQKDTIQFRPTLSSEVACLLGRSSTDSESGHSITPKKSHLNKRKELGLSVQTLNIGESRKELDVSELLSHSLRNRPLLPLGTPPPPGFKGLALKKSLPRLP
jgi:hypothetical protein